MKKELLRSIPSIDELLRDTRLRDAAAVISPEAVAESARKAVDEVRNNILSGARSTVSMDEIIEAALACISDALRSSIKRVINASGTILHTNIGRAVLSEEAAEAATLAVRGNINLEIDLATGERGERDSLVEGLITGLTGAEAACVVNNNAAAVLLALNTFAEGKEVVISRGELIEIGGSFRLPDIIRKSGCVLKEIGTTNRTHESDYESAINGNTALIFKAHTSNFRIVGFTAEVGLSELSNICKNHGLPVVEDLGSGSLIDLTRWGLPKEPVVRESIEAGADIVTFSGDKLLGGPQAGILAGKKELIAKIRKNPLKRAMRADKMTLAALEATLRLYLNPDRLAIRLPALRYMSRPVEEIEKAAELAAGLLRDALGSGFEISIEDGESVVGGGSLPGHALPTKVVSITSIHKSADEIFRLFLSGRTPVLGRINKDRFLLDMRTVDSPEEISGAVRK